MAKAVMLRHKDSGVMRTGFYGFSWTTLFFGPFPALFRSDFLTFIGYFVVYGILLVVTWGLGSLLTGLVWAFLYNGYYTRRLLERGYQFDDHATVVRDASSRLGVAPPLARIQI